MKTFFNWLQANRSNAGHYNNSMYLDVVEAGLEITRGNGWAWVTANILSGCGVRWRLFPHPGANVFLPLAPSVNESLALYRSSSHPYDLPHRGNARRHEGSHERQRT
jgi:hypothetical protein